MQADLKEEGRTTREVPGRQESELGRPLHGLPRSGILGPAGGWAVFSEHTYSSVSMLTSRLSPARCDPMGQVVCLRFPEFWYMKQWPTVQTPNAGP